MDLNQTLLNMCEEFFDEITNKENNSILDSDINHLRQKLEQCLYGYVQKSEYSLAVLAEEEISNIWHEISQREKKQNPDLECHYREIMALTTEIIENQEQEKEMNLEELDTDMDSEERSDHNDYSYADDED